MSKANTSTSNVSMKSVFYVRCSDVETVDYDTIQALFQDLSTRIESMEPVVVFCKYVMWKLSNKSACIIIVDHSRHHSSFSNFHLIHIFYAIHLTSAYSYCSLIRF